jgi:eukaryotic-like serine/threonine-protein kinase
MVVLARWGRTSANGGGGDLPPGGSAGEYQITRFLARGGCGAVYAARHRGTGREVAVKVLHGSLAASPKMVERFVREVEVVNLLRHPGIVQIFEIGELDDGRPFYAMEMLGGVTLDAVLRPDRRLPLDEVLEIVEPLCSALDAAHAAGVVHRDVKPSNIALEPGVPRVVKLLDFGIAKLTTPESGATGLTSAGRQIGTPSIMAPEQILGGPVDARIDVYALGVLVYRMLSGRLPFEASEPLELARQHLEQPPPPPSLRAPIEPALDAVILRALEKRPEQRYDSAKSFLFALQEAAGRAPVDRDSVHERLVPAVGILVELRARTEADEADDALADDLARLLDLAERRLRDEGFSVALATGNEILAVRLLPDDAEAAGRAQGAAISSALAMHRAIEARPGADGRVHVNLCVHVDRALVRARSAVEVVGGPLTKIGAWAPRDEVTGVCATPEAVAGVGQVAFPWPLVTILRRPS